MTKRLEELYIRRIKELKKVCHDPSCQEILECPLTHIECKEELGLDTAMAWLLAETVDSYLKELVTPKEFDTICAIIWQVVAQHPEEIREDVYFLIDIVTGTRSNKILNKIFYKEEIND